MADDDDRRGARDDAAPAPVGSVAEEAARLLDALGGWVSTSGYAAHAAPAEPHRPSGPRPAPDGAAEGAPQDGTHSHGSGHCEHCGAANGTGQAVACQWCPVCQGIGLLRSVRPETVERLANLAGALATALRDVATHTREAAGGAQDDPTPHGTKARGPRVQDITIDDEDQGSATR